MKHIEFEGLPKDDFDAALFAIRARQTVVMRAIS